MNCTQAERYLPLGEDADLTVADRAALDAHIAACPRCDASARAYARDRDVLGSAFGGEAPPLPFEGGLAGSVLAAIGRGEGEAAPATDDDLLAPDPGESGTIQIASASSVARPVVAARRGGGLGVMIVAAAAAAVVMILWITDQTPVDRPGGIAENEGQSVEPIDATPVGTRQMELVNGRRRLKIRFDVPRQPQYGLERADRAPGTGNDAAPALEGADVPRARDLDELESPGAGPTPTYMEGL